MKYVVPSRIAINLYDMNGNLGRVDGGMGFSLEYPRLVFTIEKAKKNQIVNENLLGKELLLSTKKTIRILTNKFKLKPTKIVIIETIPSHCGFGSKTATLLSIGHAFGKINGKNLDFRELATILRRGGTSGLGINLIDKGGFILEGGHSTEKKAIFAPSSATKVIYPAPVLSRFEMPNWDILLAVPECKKMHGKKEVDFFNRICPIPESDVEKLARITLSKVLPAVAEKEIEKFGEGINAIQNCYWKKNEIKIYDEKVANLMKFIYQKGAIGIGMSSIGPTLFVVGKKLEKIRKDLSKSNTKFKILKIVKPNNTGFKASYL